MPESALNELEKSLNIVRSDPSHLNFWNAYKTIENLDLSALDVPKQNKVKLAILGSFTVDPLKMYIDIKCRISGLLPETYIGPFNQYQQEILDQKSKLYAFGPDVIILAVKAESLLGENFLFEFMKLSSEEKQHEQQHIVDRLCGLISELTARSQALVLVNNFIIPSFTPYGILDNKIEIGYTEFFQTMNHSLATVYKESRQVYVVDLERLASSHGKNRCFDPQMYYLASFEFSNSFLPIVADECMGFIKALKNLTRKCIVLDLDNTLWGGVLGEDGFEGIKLGNDPPGNVYVDFQRLLLSYYNRGIILAINSNNNYEEAIRVIREHQYMILREQHFAAMRINWWNKTKNMIALADEIGIGLDSMVFVDDLPQNRDQVKELLPHVLVVDMPSSPYLYRQTLERLNDFNVLAMTDEDKRRGEMYYAQRKRDELKGTLTSLEDFLKTLETKAVVARADEFSVPRIARLVNKTNQFNMTTRRYTDADLKRMIGDDAFVIFYLRVKDRFGDEGIVGVAIIRTTNSETWVIDSFLVSCRVLGRGVETAFLEKIAEEARKSGVSLLAGEFIPTEKNEVAKAFYESQGFEKFQEDKEVTRYKLDLRKSASNIPTWIEVTDG